MRKLAQFAFPVAWACIALAPTAQAQPRATALGCGQGILVSSNGAPLREVLQAMANSLRFELQYLSNENPAIRLEGRHGTLELVKLLSNEANLAVRYRPDPACKGQLKIASIWVLSRASGAAATRPGEVAAPTPVTDPASMQPAEATLPNSARDGGEEFLRLHGLPPQPQR